jgi:predicted ABC-type ATPase
VNDHPEILIIAGPNGAGKSTLATALIRDRLKIKEFVNADVIAQGLAAFDVASVAIDAGRIMLARLRELARQRKSFAFETTLAARSYASWIDELKQTGYRFHLVYLCLPNAKLAVQRVADRVRVGGHHIPSDVIERRYTAGLRNFFQLYQPLAETWKIEDNSDVHSTRLIAAGYGKEVQEIGQPEIWNSIVGEYRI